MTKVNSHDSRALQYLVDTESGVVRLYNRVGNLKIGNGQLGLVVSFCSDKSECFDCPAPLLEETQTSAKLCKCQLISASLGKHLDSKALSSLMH